MNNCKSSRNKTINISIEAGRKYLERCISFPCDTAETGRLPVYTVEQICDHTICGDTFQVLPHISRACADLAIIDPPYNLSKDYAGTRFSRQSPEEYRAYTQRWLELVLPVLKPSASLYICCDWRSSVEIGRILEEFEAEHKLIVRNRITWEREKGRGAARNWKNAMEDIWFATVSGSYTFNLDAVKIRRKVIAPYMENGKPKDWEETPEGKFRHTCPSNFWNDISIPYWSMAENTAHPTQKPEKLLAKLILASSNPGEMVFDPFLGSGSTSVTAKKLGRHWCGIEHNRQYCVWAEKRLETAETDRTIQGFENGIFFERNSRPAAGKIKEQQLQQQLLL